MANMKYDGGAPRDYEKPAAKPKPKPLTAAPNKPKSTTTTRPIRRKKRG